MALFPSLGAEWVHQLGLTGVEKHGISQKHHKGTVPIQNRRSPTWAQIINMPLRFTDDGLVKMKLGCIAWNKLWLKKWPPDMTNFCLGWVMREVCVSPWRGSSQCWWLHSFLTCFAGETNAALRRSLCGSVGQVYVSSAKEIRNITQQLSKSQASIQVQRHYPPDIHTSSVRVKPQINLYSERKRGLDEIFVLRTYRTTCGCWPMICSTWRTKLTL